MWKSAAMGFAVSTLSCSGAQARCADIALVLAIDASASVDAGEYALQIEGYRAAFDDPGVQASFAAAGEVLISAVIWGDSAYRPQILPWTRIGGTDDLLRFAKELSIMPREVSGNTDMGMALKVALDLMEQGICADRLVVDISGDGKGSVVGRRNIFPMSAMRRVAEERGVIINGLAIASDDVTLPAYYESAVATGYGSFVVIADSFGSFDRAIRLKLQRELLADNSGKSAPPGLGPSEIGLSADTTKSN